jgi:hypothetical protein
MRVYGTFFGTALAVVLSVPFVAIFYNAAAWPLAAGA